MKTYKEMKRMKLSMMVVMLTICGVMNVSLGLASCSSDNDPAVPTFPDCGFNDIADVLKEAEANETIVFVIRHAERGEDYSAAGLLTENGKAQSRMVGEKMKNGEAAFYAHSNYERTKQTCECIAMGRGDEFVHEQWDILYGDYFMRDAQTIKACGLDSWDCISEWAYEGKYGNRGFYNLDQRAAEWIDSLKTHLPTMKRINVLVSHDFVVMALTIYATNRQVDFHYWVNHKWINYLAGFAIIIDPEGNMRFKTVRGLDSGYLN